MILTPHIGGSTQEAQENIGLEVAGQKSKKDLVDGGQHARTVFVNVQQTTATVQRQRHFREVNGRER